MPTIDAAKLFELVEDCFKHFHDTPYLGRSELVSVLDKSVKVRLQIQKGVIPNFLHYGKALRLLLLDGLNQLMEGPQLPDVVTAEWHNFFILRELYVSADSPTVLQVATKLKISQRTLFRRREVALRSIAEILLSAESTMEEWH